MTPEIAALKSARDFHEGYVRGGKRAVGVGAAVMVLSVAEATIHPLFQSAAELDTHTLEGFAWWASRSVAFGAGAMTTIGGLITRHRAIRKIRKLDAAALDYIAPNAQNQLDD